jgi:predicted DNA-binding protein
MTIMRSPRIRSLKPEDAVLAGSHVDAIRRATRVQGPPNSNPNSPISIRMSEPLVERLDRIAAAQHRKRSNLIQHILWEYVHAHAHDDNLEVKPLRRQSR